MKKDSVPFWRHLALNEMTHDQWESLCSGCGRCCLRKLEYEDTGEICFTRVACRHLDIESCRCRLYEARARDVPNCLILTPESLERYLYMLPETCAYRLIAQGKDLPWWHHLLSGDATTVHLASISVRGWVLSEEHVHDDELEKNIIDI